MNQLSLDFYEWVAYQRVSGSGPHSLKMHEGGYTRFSRFTLQQDS